MTTHNDYEEEIGRLNDTITKLNYVREEQSKSHDELKSIHRLLDNIHKAPPRDNAYMFIEDEKWKADTYTAMERLAIYLANQ